MFLGDAEVFRETRYINPQKHIFACAFGNDNKHMLGLKEQALLEKYTNLSAAVMSSASASFNILSNNDYPCLNGRRWLSWRIGHYLLSKMNCIGRE